MTPAKILGLLPVIIYIVDLKVLANLDIRTVFEHRSPMPIPSTFFAGIIPIFIAYVAAKAYAHPLGCVTRRILLKGIVT